MKRTGRLAKWVAREAFHQVGVHKTEATPFVSRGRNSCGRSRAHEAIPVTGPKVECVISYEVIIQLIASTTTDQGLRIKAELDTHSYPTGIKVTKQELAAVCLKTQTAEQKAAK